MKSLISYHKANKAAIFIALALLVLTLAYASSFADSSQAEFNNGTYSNTIYNGSAVILSGANLTGAYTSRIFDADASAIWSSLNYNFYLPTASSIYAVDYQASIWKSSNSGINWTKVNSSYKGSGVTADDLDIDSLGNLYILDSQDLWKSSDSGITWSKANDDFNGADAEAGKQMIIDENNIYLIDAGEDVYQSADLGITFIKIKDDINIANGDVYGLTYFNASTNLTFQARNCSQPDCSDGAWQNIILSNMNLTGRYFQYKSYFARNDISITSALINLSVEYSAAACAPILTNTSWSSWLNVSCISGDMMNQTRNLTQYDANNCGSANATFTEYRATEPCDYCSPTLTNTSWSSWINISCLTNNTMNQSRSRVQYDSNFCNEISNTTFTEYQASESCNYTAPDTSAPNILSTSPLSGASLSSGTTSAAIALTTDEISICRYNSSNVSWENMSQMESTNSTSHILNLSGLSDGSSYNYYFICEDDESPANRMLSSYYLQFSIASPSGGGSSGGGGGGGRGGSSTAKKTEIKEILKAESPLCSESWSCSGWNECKNGIQSRKCNDANSCGTSSSKPKESQKCEINAGQKENSENSPSITGQAVKALSFESSKAGYLVPTVLFLAVFIALISINKSHMNKSKRRIIAILNISMAAMVIILFASSLMNNGAVGAFLSNDAFKRISIPDAFNAINNASVPISMASFVLAAASFIMIIAERKNIKRMVKNEQNPKSIRKGHSRKLIMNCLKKIYKL